MIRGGNITVLKTRLRTAINGAKFDAQRPNTSSPLLIISNKDSRYQLIHGKQFRDLLQARDQVLEHQFYFSYDLSDYGEDQELLSSELYRLIKKNIRKFMGESVSNVISSGFKFLLKKELEEKEAMEFSSKNIMVNMLSIFRHTITAIVSHNIIKQRVNVDELKNNLILEVDSILENILINLADSYPQAPAAGGTPRMREVIHQVNRVQDEQNDFIFTSGIKISEYLDEEGNPRSDENYTEFIMRVINAAIEVTHDNSEDFKDRTIFERFTEFSENLFWVVQQKDYQKFISSIDKTSQKEQNKEKIKEICNKFGDILRTGQPEDEEEGESRKGSVWLQMDQLWSKAQDGMQDLKAKTQYDLGQKIPTAVKPFNRQEIIAKQFHAKHSSVLRILTKWAGYLEQTFKKAQVLIKQRIYPFKNLSNELINQSQDKNSANRLILRLEEEYKEFKRKFSDILKTSYEYIGKFLSEVPSAEFVSNVNRYTETRVVSSKINAVLTSLMLSYTNLLIHHLLRAGRKVKMDKKNHNINLIVFRVSDLMRSKFQCGEKGFITLLKTMYMLENSENMQGIFKLVRIKNKLDSPANNIMINYLFMGKVECQLQLSIQEAKGKEKNYYAFSHFVYQLTRGTFGSIAECAIMISQLDPMITACKRTYYQEREAKMGQHNPKETRCMLQKRQTTEDIDIQEIVVNRTVSQLNFKGVKNAFFECTRCLKLRTNESTEKFLPQDAKKICFQCIIGLENPVDSLSSQLKAILTPATRHKMSNYRRMGSLKKQKYLFQLTSAGEKKLHVVVYLAKELKTFLVQISSKILETIGSDTFDFSCLDYVSISNQIEKSLNDPNKKMTLAYLFDDCTSIPEEMLNLVKIKREELENMGRLLNQFKEFRQEKNIIKTIKFKVEIIKVGKEEWGVLDRVCKVLAVEDEGNTLDDKSSEEREVKEQFKLKYNRYKYLDLSNLTQITASKILLNEIPIWMKECDNIKKLQLQGNQISDPIKKYQLPSSLVYLNLHQNRITSIDISDLNSLTQLNLKNNQLTTFTIHRSNTLKTLHLSENLLTAFSLGDNTSLVQLLLISNKLTSFSIGFNNTLISLHLQCNQLTNLDLGSNNSLKKLSIFNNSPLKDVNYLPTSLKWLNADRSAVILYDFQSLSDLKRIEVKNGQTQRKQIIGLGDFVKEFSSRT